MPFTPRLALSATIGLLCALAGQEAAAKAAYAPLAETVERAQTIAIIHAAHVEPADIEGEHWHYRQLVAARMLDAIKGTPADNIEIAASKDFICAPVDYHAPADYLVFLADDRGHLATVNHERGALLIVDGKVEWPYDDDPNLRPLDDVLLELRALVGEPEPIAERIAQPLIEVTPASTRVDATPSTPPPAAEPEPELQAWPAALWIASGAFAVMLGMFVATRRRRSR